MSLLLEHVTAVTMDPAAPVLHDAFVLVEGTAISQVGRTRPQGAFDRVVDCTGKVMMPGLINAHTHIYSALARGLSIDGYNPTSFYEVLDGTWWAIDRHLMMDGTRASATALL